MKYKITSIDDKSIIVESDKSMEDIIKHIASGVHPLIEFTLGKRSCFIGSEYLKNSYIQIFDEDATERSMGFTLPR